MSGSPKPPAAAGGAAAAAPKSPPFGSSGATQPVPNAGFEAAALQRVGVIIKQIQDVMQIVGAGSEPGKDLLKALNILVKLAPAGNVSNASERNMLEQSLMRNTQNGQQQQMLKQQAQPPKPAAPAGGMAA